MGHREIGFISGMVEIKPGADRLAGYEAAMRKHGLTPNVVSGGFKTEGGRAAMTSLLECEREMSAVIVSNNMMTIGALRAIRDHNGARAGGRRADRHQRSLVDGVARAAVDRLRLPIRRMAELRSIGSCSSGSRARARKQNASSMADNCAFVNRRS